MTPNFSNRVTLYIETAVHSARIIQKEALELGQATVVIIRSALIDIFS
jgi:hypothetical protein